MFSQDELHPHDELHPLPFSIQEQEVFEHPFAQLHLFVFLESRFSSSEFLSLDIVRYLFEKSESETLFSFDFGIVWITN